MLNIIIFFDYQMNKYYFIYIINYKIDKQIYIFDIYLIYLIVY